MTGICGWISNPPEPDAARQTLARMTTALSGKPDLDAHNALDALGGQAACSRFGHASLFEDVGITCVVEGRIEFRDAELARVAQKQGPAAAIVTAYRRHGRGCLPQFHGAFSLAVHDPAQRALLIAIDRIGARPLCYAATADALVYGSTTDAVAAHSGQTPTLDPQGLFNYLYFHTVPAPGSIYRDICKLLPGQYALWRDGKLETDFYWHLHYDDHNRAPFDTLKQRFRTLLRESVARAAQGEHVGAFLSGGTDSTTITGVLSQLGDRPVDTYSIGFDADGFDEMVYARLAAKTFAARAHEYYLKPADIVTAIPIIAAAYDEPFANESAVPTYFCAKLAHDDGVRIMLAGDGGDEIFGGNARYAKQKIFEAYGLLPSWLRGGLIEPLARLPGMTALSPGRKLQSYIRQANVPLPDRMESYNFLHRTPLAHIFNADFLAQITPDQPDALLREVYQRSDSSHFINRMMHLDLKFTLADNDLRKVGRMTEAVGVEVRYPLLDDALLDFSGQVPVHLKVKGTRLRYFFKEALRDLLPAEIINKGKHGFGLPFGMWATTHAPLRELVQDSLADFERRGILQPAYLTELRRQHQGGHATYYGVMIWVVMMLEQWLQQRQK